MRRAQGCYTERAGLQYDGVDSRAVFIDKFSRSASNYTIKSRPFAGWCVARPCTVRTDCEYAALVSGFVDRDSSRERSTNKPSSTSGCADTCPSTDKLDVLTPAKLSGPSNLRLAPIMCLSSSGMSQQSRTRRSRSLRSRIPSMSVLWTSEHDCQSHENACGRPKRNLTGYEMDQRANLTVT